MNPIKIIKKVTENLNSIRSQKYRHAPKNIEEKTIKNECFGEVYDFNRFFKLKKFTGCCKRAVRKQLRNPLPVNEKVLVLARKLKKKDAPKQLLNQLQKAFFFK